MVSLPRIKLVGLAVHRLGLAALAGLRSLLQNASRVFKAAESFRGVALKFGSKVESHAAVLHEVVIQPCSEPKGLCCCFRSAPRHIWNQQHALACQRSGKAPSPNFTRALIWKVLVPSRGLPSTSSNWFTGTGIDTATTSISTSTGTSTSTRSYSRAVAASSRRVEPEGTGGAKKGDPIESLFEEVVLCMRMCVCVCVCACRCSCLACEVACCREARVCSVVF